MDLRGQFLLDPDVVFLNHGSFGGLARLRRVRRGQFAWCRRLGLVERVDSSSAAA